MRRQACDGKQLQRAGGRCREVGPRVVRYTWTENGQRQAGVIVCENSRFRRDGTHGRGRLGISAALSVGGPLRDNPGGSVSWLQPS